MSNATKATNAPNPKEAVGQTKLPAGLCPDTAVIEWALAQMEGALKYGRYNWRISGVRASTYHDAIKRHLAKWWNGEDADPATQVKHLGSIMACCAIILDSIAMQNFNDDRPPACDVSKMLDSENLTGRVAHLKALFASHHPRQWTIADTEPTDADRQAANNGQPTTETSGVGSAVCGGVVGWVLGAPLRPTEWPAPVAWAVPGQVTIRSEAP